MNSDNLAKDLCPEIYRPAWRGICLVLFAALVSTSAFAGTLRLGSPVVSNNRYTFPVLLQGDTDGVAALDFRLAYDPAVFSPVSAQSGTTALQAQKQVSSNIASPGEFIVVMMGFNQNSVGPGEVVEVVLDKIGEPADGTTVLRIAEPTLATHVGVEVESQGVGRTVNFASDPRSKGDRDPDPAPETVSSGDDVGNDDGSGAPVDSNGDVVAGGPLFLPGYEEGAATKSPSSSSGETVKSASPGAASTNGASPPQSEPPVMVIAPGPSGDGGILPTDKSTSGSPTAVVDTESLDRNGTESVAEAPAQTVGIHELIATSTPEDPRPEDGGRQGGQRYAILLMLGTGTLLGALILARVLIR